MKYCGNCGNELKENADVCLNCGAATDKFKASGRHRTGPSGLQITAKVFMIIGTVVSGIFIIPLAWCLPMTIKYSRRIKRGEDVGVGFKVSTLLFVNTISGILMLAGK